MVGENRRGDKVVGKENKLFPTDWDLLKDLNEPPQVALLSNIYSRLVKSPNSHASDPCSRLGGSSWLCYGIYFISEFNEMREIYFWRHLVWKAESLLSEDELSCKVLGPAVYTKIYCRVQWNRVLFIPVQWEKSGHTDPEANWGGLAVPHDKAVALAACRQPGVCRQIPYIGSERKASERYKHCEEKSSSIALRPVEIPPLYRIWRIPPHTRCCCLFGFILHMDTYKWHIIHSELNKTS